MIRLLASLILLMPAIAQAQTGDTLNGGWHDLMIPTPSGPVIIDCVIPSDKPGCPPLSIDPFSHTGNARTLLLGGGEADMTRKPDYILKALNKVTDEQVFNIGAAWKNDDGSLSLVIDRFVVLPTEPRWVYILFPAK